MHCLTLVSSKGLSSRTGVMFDTPTWDSYVALQTRMPYETFDLNDFITCRSVEGLAKDSSFMSGAVAKGPSSAAVVPVLPCPLASQCRWSFGHC